MRSTRTRVDPRTITCSFRRSETSRAILSEATRRSIPTTRMLTPAMTIAPMPIARRAGPARRPEKLDVHEEEREASRVELHDAVLIDEGVEAVLVADLVLPVRADRGRAAETKPARNVDARDGEDLLVHDERDPPCHWFDA